MVCDQPEPSYFKLGFASAGTSRETRSTRKKGCAGLPGTDLVRLGESWRPHGAAGWHPVPIGERGGCWSHRSPSSVEPH